MLSALPNNFILFYPLCRTLTLPLLVFLCFSTPSQAQLPPPPRLWNTQELTPVPTNTDSYSIPEVNNIQEYDNQSNSVEFRAPSSPSYFNDSERYIVYVENNNYQTLQQVRLIEPTAYIRNFQGRSVIQAGVFSKPDNAQRRINQLAASGIYGGQITTSSGQQIGSFPQGGNFPRTAAIGRNLPQSGSRSYYVVIPTSSEQASAIAQRIQSQTGFFQGVEPRRDRRGSHVSVGPFVKRSDAQKWKKYLQGMGFDNSRLYYGR